MHVGAIGGQHKQAGGSLAFLGGFLALATFHGSVATAAEGDCSPMLARVVSIQGGLEVLRANSSQWNQITRLDTPICQGDRLRTKTRSRAALFVRPETVTRIDENTTVAISQSPEGTELEFFDPESAPDINRGSSCGKLYAITRFPKKFKAKSRLVSGSVEGTEFQLAMRCESTELSVFEGKVLAEFLATNAEPVKVSSGESVTAGEVAAEAVKLIVSPVDAVQWALYYPPILEAGTEPASADDCKSLEPALAHACFVERADQLLRVGRVDEASEDVQQALAADPNGGEAHAILAIIKVVKNDKAGALEEAKRATEGSPNSMRAWLALSYAQQAHFQLDAALKSAQQASRYDQGSALIHARVAELLMSLGRIGEAEKEAKLAVDAQPKQSRARLILGFVHLAQINTKLAKADFLQAIELDSSDPLARLGLGLAIIREGHLQQGREEIEIAVGLDPTNSLVRSYVGKAYYEENSKDRDQLAETQFKLAKQYDERDPTPWFYEALLKQSQNRPVEALQRLQRSVELNDNRSVYRSRMLLDEDRAARSASESRIYQEIGYFQASLDNSLSAMRVDSIEQSAHKQVADAYEELPRYGFARESELLQAQMLAPAGSLFVHPQSTDAKLLALDATGPSATTPQEFNALFDRNKTRLFVSGLSGSQGTHSEEALVGKASDGTFLSIGQFNYATEGFRTNADYTQDIWRAFIQKDLSNTLSFQFELRESKTDRGDVAVNFDPLQFSKTSRDNVDYTYGRMGARVRMSEKSTLLFSAFGGRRQETIADNSTTDAFPLPIVSNLKVNGLSDASGVETQYLYRLGDNSVIAGMSSLYERIDNQFELNVAFSDGTPLFQDSRLDNTATQHSGAYLYSYTKWWNQVTATLGLSEDSLKQGYWFRGEQFNHKVGLVWDVTSKFSLRAAAFRFQKLPLVAGPTLEPSQVAGFNQLFDDVNGTDAQNKGLGLSYRSGSGEFAGVEMQRRRLSYPVPPDIGSNSPAFIEHWHEQLGRAYWSSPFSKNVAATIESQYSRQELSDPTTSTGFSYSAITTQLVPITVAVNHESGVFAQIRTTYVDQTVGFLQSGITTDNHDSFWTADAQLGYRLPNRAGVVSLIARNIGNVQFRFQDTGLNGEPRPPQLSPGRLVILSISLAN